MDSSTEVFYEMLLHKMTSINFEFKVTADTRYFTVEFF